MMNKLTKVPTVIPAISVIDMGRCNWVPMSFPHSMGMSAKIVVKLVIRMVLIAVPAFVNCFFRVSPDRCKRMIVSF